MFENRRDAGQKLAKALADYAGCEGTVLSIPRGGAEVGFYVAERLGLPLSLVVVRKLPFPDNPESGFGAIAEDGSVYLQSASRAILPTVSERIRREQTEEIQRRIQVLRDGKPLPQIADKTVILVDDGIAMGSTMLAAVRLCRNRKAGKIVAAAPVGSPAAVRRVQAEAGDAVILERPVYFRAVADFYRNWYDVSDEEVIEILQRG
jgi:putative phosphoribosyl transferase